MKDVDAVHNGEPKNAGFDPAGSSNQKSQNNHQGQFSLLLPCPESGLTGGLFSNCCFVVSSIKASLLPGVRGEWIVSVTRWLYTFIHSLQPEGIVKSQHLKKSKLSNKILKTRCGCYNTHTKPLPLVHLWLCKQYRRLKWLLYIVASPWHSYLKSACSHFWAAWEWEEFFTPALLACLNKLPNLSAWTVPWAWQASGWAPCSLLPQKSRRGLCG